MAANQDKNDTVPEKTEIEETKRTEAAVGDRTLTLTSSDGHTFDISESAAVLSETIKNMLDDGCVMTSIPLTVLDSATLAKIVKYLNKQAELEKLSDSDKSSKKKEFEEEFLKVENSDLFDLIMAANYLSVKSLLDLACGRVADLMKNKSPEWVRKTFGITNDFSPEEEEKLKQEYIWAWEGIDQD